MLIQFSDRLLRLKLKALVLDLIHHLDIVDQLLQADGPVSVGCWAWQCQLRFYASSSSGGGSESDGGGRILARQANAEFAYTYEYQAWSSGFTGLGKKMFPLSNAPPFHIINEQNLCRA